MESGLNRGGLHRLPDLLRRYKYAALVLLLGLVLLAWPFGTSEETEQDSEAATSEKVQTEEAAAVLSSTSADLEDRLADLLSEIEGAGTVTCMLTYVSGTETEYLQDTTLNSSSGEVVSETVIVSADDNTEDAVVVKETYPVFQGAVIVCDGAENAVVQLEIVQAVSSLTGLGADRITVVKRKSES